MVTNITLDPLACWWSLCSMVRRAHRISLSYIAKSTLGILAFALALVPATAKAERNSFEPTEIAGVLEMLAAQCRSHYDGIQAWKGTYECRDESYLTCKQPASLLV